MFALQVFASTIFRKHARLGDWNLDRTVTHRALKQYHFNLLPRYFLSIFIVTLSWLLWQFIVDRIGILMMHFYYSLTVPFLQHQYALSKPKAVTYGGLVFTAQGITGCLVQVFAMRFLFNR